MAIRKPTTFNTVMAKPRLQSLGHDEYKVVGSIHRMLPVFYLLYPVFLSGLFWAPCVSVWFHNSFFIFMFGLHPIVLLHIDYRPKVNVQGMSIFLLVFQCILLAVCCPPLVPYRCSSMLLLSDTRAIRVVRRS